MPPRTPNDEHSDAIVDSKVVLCSKCGKRCEYHKSLTYHKNDIKLCKQCLSSYSFKLPGNLDDQQKNDFVDDQEDDKTQLKEAQSGNL